MRSATPSPLTPPAGYADLSLCGAGTTSQVYRAINRQSGHPVALKRLHRHLAQNDEAVARLRRELEALMKLRHASIVPVRGLISWQGQPTIVMDFVEGEDLKARILREGPLPTALVVRIARALLEALAVAHAAGIVHRDIRPQNIRLADTGAVYLLDFGSARLDASSQLTVSGTAVGTPDYRAPEVLDRSVYDPRVDLYAVGATLWECLTGAVVSGTPPAVVDSAADVPEGLARLVDRCLLPSPDARFASAARALWTLDHPEEERVRAQRRSVRPPCLHCGTALPRDAGFCPACQSTQPFSFAAGPSTVRLVAPVDAAGLAAFIADRFPERGRPRHLLAVAQAGLLAPSVRPTLVVGIDEMQARRLVAELRADGVDAQVTVRSDLRRRLLDSAFIGGTLALVLSPFWPVLLALLAGVVVATVALLSNELAYALQPSGLLGDRQSRVSMVSPWTGLLAVVIALGAVGYAGVAYVLLDSFGGAYADPLGQWMWLPLATVAAGGALALLPMKTSGGRGVRRSLRSVPSVWARLWAGAKGPAAGGPSPTYRAATSLVVLVGAVAIVPLEVALLSTLAAPPSAVLSGTAPPSAVLSGTAPPSRVRSGFASRSALPIGTAVNRVAALPVAYRLILYRPATVPMVLVLLVVMTWGWMGVRRVWLSVRAQRVLRAADRDRLLRASRRVPPADRRSTRALPVGAGPGFVGAAVEHAADLEGALSTEDAVKLWRMIEGLAARIHHDDAEPRSMEARCIMESDRDLRLKFEFLRLAGELETRAARTWLTAATEERR